MRPRSILYFERLYLAGAAADLAAVTLFDFPDPEIGMTGSILVLAITCALLLAFWFYIAVRANPVWKWLLCGMMAAGLLSEFFWPEEAQAEGWAPFALGWIATLLNLAAVVFLFRRDARRWFATRGAGDVDPKIFA